MGTDAAAGGQRSAGQRGSKRTGDRGVGYLFRPKYPPEGMTYAAAKAGGALREVSGWWFKIRHRGKTLKWNTHETTRAGAERFRRKKLGELGAGRPVGPDVERTTFADLAEMLRNDYRANGLRSLERVETAIRHLEGYFAGDLALDITADRVTAYVAARQGDRAASATINRELAALKRMFRLGERARKVAHRPYMALLAEDNTRSGFFERDQFDAVLARLPDDLKPVFEAAYITGWRVKSEILTRQWAHVDFRAGWLRLEPGEAKNREGRNFPLTPQLRGVLERQRERTEAVQRATDRIVPSVFHRGGTPIRSFRRAWLSACKAAGFAVTVERADGTKSIRPARIPHDLRRTAVRNLERASVPRSVAMKMVGHKTESVYRRYAIADDAMLRDGALRLAALHDAEEAGQGRDKSGRVVPLPSRAEGS